MKETVAAQATQGLSGRSSLFVDACAEHSCFSYKPCDGSYSKLVPDPFKHTMLLLRWMLQLTSGHILVCVKAPIQHSAFQMQVKRKQRGIVATAFHGSRRPGQRQPLLLGQPAAFRP